MQLRSLDLAPIEGPWASPRQLWRSDCPWRSGPHAPYQGSRITARATDCPRAVNLASRSCRTAAAQFVAIRDRSAVRAPTRFSAKTDGKHNSGNVDNSQPKLKDLSYRFRNAVHA